MPRRILVPVAAVGVALALLVAGCGDDGGDDEPALWDAREYISDNLDDTIGTLLWENPAIRADYERRAEEDEPDLWAEINADGEVTYEEFRSTRAVANTVLHYTDDFVAQFQDDLSATPE